MWLQTNELASGTLLAVETILHLATKGILRCYNPQVLTLTWWNIVSTSDVRATCSSRKRSKTPIVDYLDWYLGTSLHNQTQHGLSPVFGDEKRDDEVSTIVSQL